MIGQLANIVAERPQGALPNNTERNLREHVKAITLRSGRELMAEDDKKLAIKNEKESKELVNDKLEKKERKAQKKKP